LTRQQKRFNTRSAGFKMTKGTSDYPTVSLIEILSTNIASFRNGHGFDTFDSNKL
jgi:hypothetical protein